jgi:hypothetical protein
VVGGVANKNNPDCMVQWSAREGRSARTSLWPWAYGDGAIGQHVPGYSRSLGDGREHVTPEWQ